MKDQEEGEFFLGALAREGRGKHLRALLNSLTPRIIRADCVDLLLNSKQSSLSSYLGIGQFTTLAAYRKVIQSSRWMPTSEEVQWMPWGHLGTSFSRSLDSSYLERPNETHTSYDKLTGAENTTVMRISCPTPYAASSMVVKTRVI